MKVVSFGKLLIIDIIDTANAIKTKMPIIALRTERIIRNLDTKIIHSGINK